MQECKKMGLLYLFGEAAEGEIDQDASVPTPQAQTGDEGTSAAGKDGKAKPQEKEFRALMEGEYKELFTAYFQETFNRRFKEQKEMQQQLADANAMLEQLSEHFGVPRERLLDTIRTKEEENASADRDKQGPEESAGIDAAALDAAVAQTRADTEQAILESIRARGLRPREGALSDSGGDAMRGRASGLSRAQRAEVARRAALGERVKL